MKYLIRNIIFVLIATCFLTSMTAPSKDVKRHTFTDDCDTLLLNNGKVLLARVLKVRRTEIELDLCEEPFYSNLTMDKTNISIIHYANGLIVVYKNGKALNPKQREFEKKNIIAYLGMTTSIFLFSFGLFFLFIGATFGLIYVLAGLVLGILNIYQKKKKKRKLKGKN